MSVVKGRGRGIRAGRGSRRLEMSAMRQALLDHRFWTGVGLVYKPSGEAAHFEIDDDIGCLVHVRLMPNEEPLLCRLGGLGEGGANGVWRVPPVDSEVAVLVPDGYLENDPILIGVLSSGSVPEELDGETLVVKSPQIVIIADGAVEVGQKGLGPLDGVVHGSGIDPFTGQTYAALNNTSSTLKAKK